MHVLDSALDVEARQLRGGERLDISATHTKPCRPERLTTRLFSRSDLSALVPHWADLTSRTADDNVYYAPHYALSLLDTMDRKQNVQFVTVWDRNSLIALLPVAIRPVPVPGLIATGTAWSTVHTYCCTPLLDRTRPLDAAIALVEALSRLGSGEWVIPNINMSGTAAKALVAALNQRGSPWVARGPYRRAVLNKGPSFEEHMRSRVSSKRRRELARNRRRLEELGAVSHRCATSGEGLNQGLSAFLNIEASGWKGMRGTALACNPQDEAFARTAFGTTGEHARCRIDTLLLDEKPIAAGVIVFSGSTGFTVKNAYDEAFASYSAGLLLEVEVLKSFLSEDWAERLDSGTNGRHVIDCLWPDNAEVAELVFSLAASAGHARLRSYVTVRSLQEQSKSRLKHLIDR